MRNTSGQYKIQECMYYSDNSILYKAVDSSTNTPVILKTVNAETMSPKELAKLRNEYTILSKLKSKFVSESIDFVKIDENFFLVLKYYSGISIAEYIKEHKIEIGGFLFLARAIVKGLSDIHGAGIIHKDLNPSNIIYDAGTHKVTIIDFGISAEFSYEKPLVMDPSSSVGTLFYLSPEQTGRMNRAIDFRTDFYSLGITFFEMLCGSLPFNRKNPTELIYDHVAKLPPQVRELNPEVPEMLSRMVYKLMAKRPEDRYFNAEGILYDLNQCITGYEAYQIIPEFDLGLGDFSDRIEIPHKLYGREKEIAILEEAYHDVLNGGKCSIFIGGRSGIGKTALAGDIHRIIIPSNGILLSGKLDQYQRNIPYLALLQVINNFCDIILAESEHQIAVWKKLILEALGQDACLLADRLPRLSLIIGQTPPPPELTPVEAGVRFDAAIQRLLVAVASPNRPIIVFIDDLHLAVAGSIDILEEIMDNDSIRGLMIISCYRDNEVKHDHPVNLSLNEMIERGADVRQFSLDGLDHASVVQMLSETLNSTYEAVADLAKIVYDKTYGNPFYIKQFLMICHANRSIRFNKWNRSWEWDIETISTCPAEENVVDFIIRNLGQLTPETSRLLSLGACGGRSFSAALLEKLSGMTSGKIIQLLKQAVSLEIIYPLQNTGNEAASTWFQFSHNRFQQAFYTIMPDCRRQNIHYQLAKFYEESTLPADRDAETKFAIADNYSKAFDIIRLPSERIRIIRLLFNAAVSANLLSSYELALRYLEQILQNTAELSSVEDNFTFSVYAAYHSTLCRLFFYQKADEIYPTLQKLAPSPTALADSCCLQAVALSNRGQYNEGFMLGIGLLEELGVYFPADNLYHTTMNEIEKYYETLKKEGSIGIKDRTEATDKKEFVISKLLCRIAAAGLFYSPLYSAWMVITNAKRILKYGYTPEGLQLYADLTLVLTPFKNDYKLSYAAANEAKKIAEQSGYKNQLFRIYHSFSLFTLHWSEDVRSAIPYSRESMKGNVAAGDFEYACYSYFTTQQAVLETCQSINELSAENKSASAYAVKTGNRHAAESYISYTQFIKSLKGETDFYGSFDDGAFNEYSHLENIRANQMAQCYYYILRALSSAIYLDYDTAYELTEKVSPLMPTITGFYLISLHNFLHSLSICKRLENHDCSEPEKIYLWETLEENQKWLGERAADAPVNFLHLHSIIDAEIAALRGDPGELIVLYEKAIYESEKSNRPYHYAMFCELTAIRYIKLNALKTAAAFLRAAYSAYLIWEADGKIEQLRKGSSNLLLLSINYIDKKDLDLKAGAFCRTDTSNISDINFNALITASQTISGEMNIEAILDKLINILLEISGAQHIYYLTKGTDNSYVIRAEGHSEGEIKNIAEERTATSDYISLRIVNYVDRTGETIALDNASRSSIFMQDEHISIYGAKSILCMPVVNKGDLKGILYLENKLIEGLFNKKRLEALSVISSQLAISLENAYLYSNLQFLVDNRTKELQEEIAIRQTAEKQLEYMANHDMLTDLPNRRMFQNYLEQSIKAASYTKSTIAVLFIDLDGFKSINDQYGHDSGDAILMAIAGRLTKTVRSCDMVCRLGGDEFILVIEDVKSRKSIERLCGRIINSIKEPIQIDDDGTTAVVTSSIGISLLWKDGNKAEELITNSDRAMYMAKNNGKNRYAFYSY